MIWASSPAQQLNGAIHPSLEFASHLKNKKPARTCVRAGVFRFLDHLAGEDYFFPDFLIGTVAMVCRMRLAIW